MNRPAYVLCLLVILVSTVSRAQAPNESQFKDPAWWFARAHAAIDELDADPMAKIDSRLRLAGTQRKLGDFEGAKQAILAAFEAGKKESGTKPLDDRFWRGIADYLSDVHEYETAQEACRMAYAECKFSLQRETKPEYQDFHFGDISEDLVCTAAQQTKAGDHQGSRKTLQDALETALKIKDPDQTLPNKQECLRKVAVGFAAAGHFDLAEKSKKVLEKEEAQSLVEVRCALAHSAQGDSAATRRCLERIRDQYFRKHTIVLQEAVQIHAIRGKIERGEFAEALNSIAELPFDPNWTWDRYERIEVLLINSGDSSSLRWWSTRDTKFFKAPSVFLCLDLARAQYAKSDRAGGEKSTGAALRLALNQEFKRSIWRVQIRDELLRAIADCQVDVGDLEGAEATIRLNFHYWEKSAAAVRLAKVAHRRGEAAMAKRTIAEALKSVNFADQKLDSSLDTRDRYGLIADAANHIGERPIALEAALNAVYRDDDNVDAAKRCSDYCELAKRQFFAGDKEGSTKSLGSAREQMGLIKDTESRTSRLNMIETLAALDDPDGAITVHASLEKGHPAEKYIAAAFVRTGRTVEAREWATKNNCHSHIAYELAKSGKWDLLRQWMEPLKKPSEVSSTCQGVIDAFEEWQTRKIF